MSDQYYHKPSKSLGRLTVETPNFMAISTLDGQFVRGPLHEFITLAEYYQRGIHREPKEFLDHADKIARLVEYVRPQVERHGIPWLIDTYSTYYASPCGCMGPQDLPICPCAVTRAITENLTVILNHFDPDAALRLMRTRLIQALR